MSSPRNPLRDAANLIASIEEGELRIALGNTVQEVVAALYAQSRRSRQKIRGNVTLSLAIELQGSTCSIEPEISSRVPKERRGSSVYFATPQGELSVDHPQQEQLFPGPREVAAGE